MIKVVIDETGHFNFVTPNGERIPSVVGSKIDWEFMNQGWVRVELIIDAYLDNNK
jgi:hypothetical protein